MNAAAAPEAALTGTQGESPADGITNRAPAVDPGLEGDEPEGGGGEGLLGGVGGIAPRQTRMFTDPRNGKTYPIVNNAVLVAFLNPPQLPLVDANYFDVPRSRLDPVYNIQWPELINDPQIHAFIVAENLDVYNEWKAIKLIAANLPPGQTVEDAVANWPVEYSGIVEYVNPVSFARLDSWPAENPNDFWFGWNLRESACYDINIQQAWRSGIEFLGSPCEVIAVLDSGVQRDHPDIGFRLTSNGVNANYSSRDIDFTLGRGEPYPWLLDFSAGYAIYTGHGTCVASAAVAGINNDGTGQMNPLGLCGIAYYNQVLPVAITMEYIESIDEYAFADDTIFNAYYAVALMKGLPIDNPFPDQIQIPNCNIEVINASFSDSEYDNREDGLVNYIAYYIVFVASAGNDGSTTNSVNWPASCMNALSVAAHNSSGNRLEDSNYCQFVDIAAPGSHIYVADMVGQNSHGDWLGYSFGLLDYVVYLNGTSLAAPHVTAVAALLSSKDRLLWPQHIRERIINTAADLNSNDPLYGRLGRLDAYAALSQ
ncbi:MAG: S8 family serine peptidase [bacterium]